MKKVLKNIIFLIIVVNIFSGNIFARTNLSNLSETNKRDALNVDSKQVDVAIDDLPWAYSVFLSGGVGNLQGFRFEIGYNIGSVISLALTYGVNDKWSRVPENGTIGMLVRIYLFRIQFVKPYILFGAGSTVDLFGDRTDSHSLIQLGAKISLADNLQLCPEFGFVYTSRYVSGGKGMFGGTSVKVTDDERKMGFSVSLQISL